MPSFYYINGEYLPVNAAHIHIHELGFLRGYGIFDFMQVREGINLFFDDYLDRFQYSAAQMDLEIPLSIDELKATAKHLAKLNGFERSGMKIILTGGYSEDGFSPAKPNLYLLEQPFSTPSTAQYNNGIKLMIHEYRRELPDVKTLSYITPIRLIKKWKSVGAFDVLYHLNGNISESARSNFFIVNADGVLITPEKDVLRGITRKKILEIAPKHLETRIAEITLDDLRNAREAFMTSSTKGALPVVQVDDMVIGDGKVGDIAPKLQADFEALSNAYIAERRA